MDEHVFVNGFSKWITTFFQVVDRISTIEALEQLSLITNLPDEIKEAKEEGGYMAVQDLAVEWTDEFEELNKGREWDGEFLDEIDKFLDNKVN